MKVAVDVLKYLILEDHVTKLLAELCPKKYIGDRDPRRCGKMETLHLTLHRHHQNDFCIKMVSDESHFNISLIVRDKVTRQRPQTTTFLERKESRSGFETRSLCLPA